MLQEISLANQSEGGGVIVILTETDKETMEISLRALGISFWVSYRVTTPLINTPILGPYGRTIPRDLWWSLGGGCFL